MAVSNADVVSYRVDKGVGVELESDNGPVTGIAVLYGSRDVGRPLLNLQKSIKRNNQLS